MLVVLESLNDTHNTQYNYGEPIAENGQNEAVHNLDKNMQSAPSEATLLPPDFNGTTADKKTLESLNLSDTPRRSVPVERWISTDTMTIVCL